MDNKKALQDGLYKIFSGIYKARAYIFDYDFKVKSNSLTGSPGFKIIQVKKAGLNNSEYVNKILMTAPQPGGLFPYVLMTYSFCTYTGAERQEQRVITKNGKYSWINLDNYYVKIYFEKFPEDLDYITLDDNVEEFLLNQGDMFYERACQMMHNSDEEPREVPETKTKTEAYHQITLDEIYGQMSGKVSCNCS